MPTLQMPRFQHLTTLGRTSTLAIVVGSIAALGAGPACSLVVESRSTQCQTDDDCSGFENARCDVAGGVCLARETSGTAGCIGAEGCFSCEPTVQVEFLTACTDAECIPFDNAQLEGLLLEDGSLPPVP